jgi:hypothetical protein
MRRSRRSAIKAIAAATVTAPLAGQHQHGSAALIQLAAAPAKPKFFTLAQMESLAALTDLIIPRTDTPGAADAGVPRIIDATVAKAPDLQEQWTELLGWADAEAKRAGADAFPKLPNDRQVDIVKRAPGFTLLKNATIDAYYSTREGLVTELGWNANTFLPEFKGCTHPEHQG